MALTKGDLSQIRTIVKEEVKVQLDETLEEKFDEKFTNFKSELFDRIDPILKEVQTAREERSLIENRLEALEEIHQKGPHSLSQ